MEKIKIDAGVIFSKTKNAFLSGDKVVIHKGGTGSGKTFDLMIYLFTQSMRETNTITTVVSESYPHLEIGTIRILSGICKPLGLWTPQFWNKTKSLWTSPNGAIIEFFSADRIDKALGARRDRLYGNEVNSLKVEVWDELARRSEQIIADFNPTAQFWLEDWILNYDDVKVITSNYLDNVFLPDTESSRIAKRAARDSNFSRIHIDCEYGVYEGLVFEHWSQIDEMPEGNYKFGMDWGFTNDPSTIIKVIETDEAIYADEILYRTGMLNREIIAFMESVGIKKRYDEIIADSAEPKSIEEVSQAGYNIKPAKKGADSIVYGISNIKSKQLFVTKRSVNLIKELRNYSWVVDKNGQATNKPIDSYNHLIDALRYATEQQKPKSQGIRKIRF